jgi:tetratricopeptide (TPR) repeat protein
MMRSRAVQGVLGLALAFLIPLAASGRRIVIQDPREKQLDQQLEDNKEWLKEAREEQKDYYEKAKRYYKRNQYARAREYYKIAANYRYKHWVLRETGRSGSRTLQPGVRTTTSRLDTRYTELAEEALETLDEKVAEEREAAAHDYVKGLFDRAEAAEMLQDYAKAYRTYEAIARTTRPYREDKKMVSYLLKASEKQQEIVGKMTQPLEKAEKLIKEDKPAEAHALLESFAENSQALFGLMPGVKERYDALMAVPAMTKEAKESEVQQKILLGEAALARGDYIGAQKHYREATTNYPESPSREKAAAKLAELLDDPAMVEKIREQQISRVCRPRLARARYLVNIGQPEEAREICEKLIEEFPDTEYADKARALLDTLAQERPGTTTPEE